MYKTITPLAVSAHVPDERGGLYCFSLHNKTINLINRKDQLITLHCYNSGLSPMGWSLKKDDFHYIYSKIRQNKMIFQSSVGDLIIDNICIRKETRRLELKLRNTFSISQDVLSELLGPIHNHTGLFGSLNKNIIQTLPDNLKKFTQQFVLLLEGKPFELSTFVGLGPGLTPSFDDMIIGVLVVLYSDNRLINQLKSPLVESLIEKLEQLTTKVSATFLRYAFQGIFTSNILAVIPLFRQYKPRSLSINKLIGYGHTSGVDLLLGIWLGTVILQEYHLSKGVKYARS